MNEILEMGEDDNGKEKYIISLVLVIQVIQTDSK